MIAAVLVWYFNTQYEALLLVMKLYSSPTIPHNDCSASRSFDDEIQLRCWTDDMVRDGRPVMVLIVYDTKISISIRDVTGKSVKCAHSVMIFNASTLFYLYQTVAWWWRFKPRFLCLCFDHIKPNTVNAILRPAIWHQPVQQS